MNIWGSLKPDPNVKDFNDVMREQQKQACRSLIVFGLLACWCVAWAIFA